MKNREDEGRAVKLDKMVNSDQYKFLQDLVNYIHNKQSKLSKDESSFIK